MAIRIKLVDKLKAENERLKVENDQLRDAARQMMEGLSRYAKEESWRKIDAVYENQALSPAEWVWVGEGDGPKTARYFLGLEENKN